MTLTPTERRMKRSRFSNKYSLGAMAFLWLLLAINDNARYWVTGILQPAIVQEFNVDPATMGWFAGGLTIAQGLLAIPLGAWSDRGGHGWKRKYRYTLIVVGYTVFTLLTGIGALTNTLLMIFILQAFNKALSGAGEAVEVTSINEWWPLERRGFATGMHHTAIPWGMFLGGLAVAGMFTVVGVHNWRIVLFLPVLLIIPVLVLWWRFSTKERYAKFEQAVVEAGETPPLRSISTEAKAPAGALRRALRNPNLVFVSLITGLNVAVYIGISTWIPLYLAFVADYDMAQVAALSFVFTLTGGLGQIFWGGISDRIGRKPALVISFLWIALGLVLLQFIGISILVLVLVQLFLGCAINGVYASLYALTSDSCEPGTLGLGMGMNMTGQLLGGMGPIMVGLLIAAGGGYSSATGFIWALYGMAGLMVLAAALLILFTRETVGWFKARDRGFFPREVCIPDPSIRDKDLGTKPIEDSRVPVSIT